MIRSRSKSKSLSIKRSRSERIEKVDYPAAGAAVEIEV